MQLTGANHYEFEGVVAGTVDTSSLNGQPVVSVRVAGEQAENGRLAESEAGLSVTADLGAQPDAFARHLLLLVPSVNVADTPIAFAGVAIVTTAKTTIGGPRLVNGVVHSYTVHPVVGQASVVDF